MNDRSAERRRSYQFSMGTIMLAVTVSAVAFVLMATDIYSQETSPQESTPAADRQVTNRSTPVDVYRSYLNAIKRNDLRGAKACWWLPGDDTSTLDVIAGMWVASHRFNAAIEEAGVDQRLVGNNFTRDDCTDAAIDRTLARLEHSEVIVTGNTAKLLVRWDDDDGYPNPVFWFGDGPIPFRRTEHGWHLDALAICGIEKSEDFFTGGGWGSTFRLQTEMMNEVAFGLESGNLKSAMDVVHALEKHVGSLEGKVPLTRTVVYEEDSPARHLRITKGDPGVVCCAGANLPHRKDIDYPRRVEGDLRTIFTEMYGIDHPRIVVETKSKKGYEVIFDPDDKKAMEIVANQLGMAVGKEDREILAMQITIAQDGHHLQEVKKPAEPQWDACVTDKAPTAAERHWVWPLHGVSMDELALFLESRYRRPVVNKTGLDGYYWLELSDEAAKLWPQELDEIKPLDQTGLRLCWKPTTTTVLVVKDR